MNFLKYPDFIRDRFKDEEVHVIGSGPSLYGFDYSKLAGCRIITVNHAYKLIRPEFNVFLDSNFYNREDPQVWDNVMCMTRERHILVDRPQTSRDHVLFKRATFYSDNPDTGVYSPSLSGSCALTAALHSGARLVRIYGFDCTVFDAAMMREVAENAGVDPPPERPYVHSTSGKFNHMRDDVKDRKIFEDKIKLFSKYPTDRVVNMSPWSAIPYFRKEAP